MQLVALLTDFGIVDYYVAQLKGEIYSACPSVNIIDISHNVAPYNINVGAWMLKNTYNTFPKGTIFMVRIAEQHFSYQRLLACKYNGYFFLVPDNGIITMILEYNNPDILVAIDTNVLPADTNTKHYIRALKEIVYSQQITSVGNVLTTYKKLLPQLPLLAENTIRGYVMYIDYFGNAITNIHCDEFRKYNYSQLKIQYRRKEHINSLVSHYHQVGEGESLARFNETGYMEIAIRNDSAASLLGLKPNDIIMVEFLEGL